MEQKNRILVINLGSTSTKVAVYEYERALFEKNIEHSVEEIAEYTEIGQQMDMRKDAVISFLSEVGVEISSLAAVAARGGLIDPLKGGAYLVDDNLVEACKNSFIAHVTNFAAVIGYEIAKAAGINAYIYDAPCVDEADEITRTTGLPEIKRPILTHVLNSRAVALKVADEEGRRIEDITVIVAHMGGGISSNVICRGRFIDVISDDEGTFSPERAGKLPSHKLLEMCFESGLDKRAIQKKLRGKGGLVAHLGTSDIREAEKMMENGDSRAQTVFRAMALQIAKDIGSLSVVANGEIDYIILTGGVAYSKMMTDLIRQRVEFIAPVKIVPGAYEMDALAGGISRVLRGEEQASRF